MSQASVVDDGDGDVVMAGYNFVEDCVLVRPAGFPRDRVTEKEDSITVLRAIDVWKRPHSPRFRHRRHSLHQALAEHSQKDKAAVALHMTISLCGKSIPSALLLQHPECSENVSTLHDAVTARSLASVHVLLRAGASVDRRSHMGAECTALQYALAIKNIPAVEALLVAGASIMTRATERGYNSVLHLSAATGCAGVLVALLCYARALNKDAGLVSACNADGETALHVAARAGNFEAVVILLAQKCPCNVQRFSDESTALHLAVLGGYGNIVKLLLDKGASILNNSEGCTAFRCAVRSGHQEILCIFLVHCSEKHGMKGKGPRRDLGDYLVERDFFGGTMLHDAILIGCCATVRLLLHGTSKEDTNECVERSPSHNVGTARVGSSVVIIPNLPVHDAALLLTDNAGRRPLHLAVARGYIDIVVAILTYKASIVDLEDDTGMTALEIAIEEESEAMCRVLIEHGAAWKERLLFAIIADDVWSLTVLLRALAKPLERVSCLCGQSLLYMAARNRSIGVMQALIIDNGADANETDSSGFPLLHSCVQRSDSTLVQALIDGGADVDAQDTESFTALMKAVRRADDSSSIVDILLNNGASVHLTNTSHQSALYFAVWAGSKPSVASLLRHGASIDVGFDNCGSAIFLSSLLGGFDLVAAILSIIKTSVDYKDNTGRSALEMAVDLSDRSVVEFLLAHGASATQSDCFGNTILYRSVANAMVDHEIVHKLIEHNAHVVPNSHDKLTPLHMAARRGDSHTAEILLNAFPETRAEFIDAVEIDGKTPLYFAIKAGSMETTALLVRFGANVHARDWREELDHVGIAIKYNRLDIIDYLLDSGEGGGKMSVKKRSGSNMISPLHSAVQFHNLSAVKSLVLVHNASVDITTRNGWTPLHVASGSNAVDIAAFLLEMDANVNARNNEGRTALGIAVVEGQTEVARLLLSKGASVAIPRGRRGFFIPEGSWLGRGLLHAAVYRENIDLVTVLLDHYSSQAVSVDDRDDHDLHSPLGIAARFGGRNLQIAELLLNRGASPGTGGENMCTPLYWAAGAGNTAFVKLLLDKGSVPGHCFNPYSTTALYPACDHGYLDIVKILLPLLTPRQMNKYHKIQGDTPLLVAIKKGYRDIVDLLLKHGASPHTASRKGKTPLSLVAAQVSTPSSTAMLESLLCAGANPSIFNDRGMLPLHEACFLRDGDGGVVRALLDHPNVSISSPCPGMRFFLPLHIAAINGHHHAVRALTSKNACLLEAKTATGCTALAQAVERGHTETVRALLEAGARLDVVTRDNKGIPMKSLVHQAAFRGHGHVCTLLLQAMAIQRYAARVHDTPH